MGLESPKGTKFYTGKGLKPVTINLPPKVHDRLKKLAQQEERSLQVTVRRILSAYINKIGTSIDSN